MILKIPEFKWIISYTQIEAQEETFREETGAIAGCFRCGLRIMAAV